MVQREEKGKKRGRGKKEIQIILSEIQIIRLIFSFIF